MASSSEAILCSVAKSSFVHLFICINVYFTPIDISLGQGEVVALQP